MPVLPYQLLEELIDKKCIITSKAQLQPASIDLKLSDEIYRTRGIFLPKVNEKVEDLVEETKLFRHDLDLPIEVGATYVAKLEEKLELPDEVYGYANPKSSAGRVDLQVRLLADGTPRFDTVPRGYKGQLWTAITSKSFLIKLNPGDSVIQLRLLDSDSLLDHDQLQAAYSKHKMLFSPDGKFISYDRIKINDFDGSLILTLDFESQEVIGYKAIKTNKILDFSQNDAKVEDFFVPINKAKNLLLERESFYLFFTKEWLRMPPQLAAEISAIDTRSGDFRSHYAGFIDPGFGYNEKGTPVALELRSFENELLLRDNQPICKIYFERLREEPKKLYGKNSHYQNQSSPLSRHFKI